MNATARAAALDYLPRWLAHQMRVSEQTGCAVAVVDQGRCVFEAAFGHADMARGEALTPRHRFRVASHSKSFTAAGILKLREQGRLQLDDAVGQHVPGLHPQVASATLAQLLSHSAGLVRDGADAGQWADRRPFLNEAELRADLAAGAVIDANTRFKYSNHGYALLGLTIQAVTNERYVDWIAREVVAAAGLTETLPDMPPVAAPASKRSARAAAANADTDGADYVTKHVTTNAAAPPLLAAGHSAKWPLGRRVVIPGRNPTHVLASATGFISTAADLARFYAQLSPNSSSNTNPNAKSRLLSVASRREMARRQWRDPHSSQERWYGLGTISATLAAAAGAPAWEVFGHSGGFQGSITRTAVVPAQQLAVSVLTNASDGLSHTWLDGCLHILRAFDAHGGPSRRTAPWAGRWWSLWGAFDLLPMGGDKVLLANPALANPLLDATELSVHAAPRSAAATGVLTGRIALAGGYGNHGEPVRLVRDEHGVATEFWLGGSCFRPEAQVVRELRRKYDRR